MLPAGHEVKDERVVDKSWASTRRRFRVVSCRVVSCNDLMKHIVSHVLEVSPRMFQSASKTFVVPSRLLETSWLVFDDSMQYFFAQ